MGRTFESIDDIHPGFEVDEGFRLDGAFGGRYQPVRLLGTKHGARTVLATDRSDGRTVVVKAVSTTVLSPGTQMRLEHEAALLHQLRSRHVAPLLEVDHDEGTLYLVMPFVPGVSLASRLGRGRLELRDALSAGCCLFSALVDLHGRRVLHRDVKPGHLIINDDAPLVRATLIGFGPARGLLSRASVREEPLKTALYVSPEQAGSLDCDVGEPSDLYSAGIVLFECLAGRPPFTGDNVGEVLFQHMTARVPELRDLRLEVPRALDEVILRLLRKDPRDRYQSADAALGDLKAIAEALERGVREPRLVVGVFDRRLTLTEPAFVGRDRELDQLDHEIGRARGGRGGLVLLEGESGGGKTRLLAEMMHRGAREGLSVLRGEGTTEVGQRPFQLLGGVVQGFLAAARSDPALAEQVRRHLGVFRDALSSALPDLADALGWETSHLLGPETFGEARSIQAISEFLGALGSQQRPALIVLDDCQWADELTTKLIAHWHAKGSEAGAAGRYALLVAAFRSEEVSQTHLLRRLRPSAHLRLSPFEPEDVRRLVESMAGPLPAEAVDVVTRLSEGSPFMASAVLRGLVESGALVGQLRGWRVEPLAMADLQSSDHAAALLSRRLELLPAQTIQLLSVAAVLGKEFDLNMAAELARQQPSQAIAALDEARRRHLAWVRPDGSQCVFVHDKIRSALLERLSASEREDLHRRAAFYLQKHAPDRANDLAYHFDAAGESTSALEYALRAAEQARSQHSLEIAEQQYRIAERGAMSADRATCYRIAEGLGDALMLRGRYDAAAPLFQRAAKLAEGEFARAQIRGKLGELAFKRGDKKRAVSDFIRALRLLGRRVPRRLATFVVLLVWETLIQVLHTHFPSLFVHRRKREPAPEVLLALRLFSRLTEGYWFTHGKIQLLWAHLRGMNLGESYRPTLELANAYSEHAPVIALIPMFRRAIKYSQKSLEIRKSFGDLWGQGQSLSYYSCVLYYASRFAECVQKGREAVRLLERMGDYWLVHIARYQVAASLYHMGDLPAAVEEARRNHKSGLELGDEQASGIILDVWGRATGGAVPQKILQKELQRELGDAQGTAQVLLADALAHLGAGDAEGAAAALEKSIEVAADAGVKNAYTLPALTWLATAYRRQAEEQTGYTPQRRRALLRRAQRVARRALRAARICRNDVPHVLREYALILAMRGKTRKCRRCFDESLAVAREHGARYEYAQTLLAREQVARELGWPPAADEIADAQAALAEMAAPSENDKAQGQGAAEAVTLSLADRFDTVVDSGGRIASALSATTIYEEVRRAALRLLRGERCLLVQIDRQDGVGRLTPMAGEVKGNFSRRMVQQAIEAGRAVAFVEEVADDTQNGAASSGQCSALCAPIFVRGRATACLYVTHQHVRGLFGPDEERLANFIANIAGAALENAEGFLQLQRLNETLEHRVAERTAAAEARAEELARSNRELERVACELRETEEQLRVAMESAEAANRAKSHFLAMVTHEIRTPMNGILGMTELALNTPLTSEQSGYLGTVKQSADALLRLLNDVLDFSKIEAGRLELEKVAFDLREVVGDAVNVLAVPASQKSLELILQIDADVPQEVVGDPGRLRQILVNLVGNAVKFTQQGEVLLSVVVEKKRPRSVDLHLAIQDTGIGIAPDKQEHIFESFSQADGSTTRRFGGTGLGLAISSELVGLMGGRIWVESELGRGSTFHFTAPLGAGLAIAPQPVRGQETRAQREKTPAERPLDAIGPAEQNELPSAVSPATRKQSAETVLQEVSVLFVDDNATSRRVYGELLRGHGMRTTLADGPDAALALLKRAVQAGEPFRLILLDVVMPGADAWALVKKIRKDPDLKRSAIVPMLPAGPHNGSDRCRRLGLEPFLIKPAKERELVSAVLHALRGQQTQNPSCRLEAGVRERAPLRILLAEDGPVNQEVAVGLLRLRGHQVEVVDNGKAALQALERESFDAVLMDIEMPEMDGLEATAALRQKEKNTEGHVPVIAMTAHAVKGFRERCIQAGMDGYISKPIQPAELYQALESALSNIFMESGVEVRS